MAAETAKKAKQITLALKKLRDCRRIVPLMVIRATRGPRHSRGERLLQGKLATSRPMSIGLLLNFNGIFSGPIFNSRQAINCLHHVSGIHYDRGESRID